MSGFGTTPTTTGQGILATNQFPIAEVYVPNTTNGNLTALQGGTSSTDGNGNASAPVMAQLAAGSAVVGHVIVDSAGAVSVVALPALPAGTNAIGTVGVTSLPTLPAGTNVIGHVIVDSAGSVSVTSLPSLPAGSNLIGGTQLVDSAGTNKASVSASGAVKVDGSATTQPVSLASLPTLPAGTNVIGHVIVDSAGSVSVTSLPSLPAGTNVIGHVIVDSAASVSVTSLPALPAGSNAIGSVTATQTTGSNLHTVVDSGTVTANIQHGNVVDSANSSTTPLTSGAIFTGTSQSSLSYSAVAIEAYSDQASAVNGLQVLQSQDGTNFDQIDSFSVSAATPFTTVVNLVGQYYKVKYTNGSTNQATFRLQTIKQAAESVLPRTLTANGNLKVALQEDNTAGLATSANQSTANTSLASIATNTSNAATHSDATTINTTLGTLATQTTMAAAKADLDTLVTQTSGLATSSAQTTTNTSLSTIATNTGTSATQNTTTATNTGNTASVLGTTTDAAVVGDNPGTISAKQRGLSKIWNDVWDSVNHWLQVKVMNTVPVSGTFWQATQPVSGAMQLLDSGGTNKATIDASGNQQVKGGFTEQASLSAGALNADLVPSTDVSAYKSFSLHVTPNVFSGAITIQGSNDNVNFEPVPSQANTSLGVYSGYVYSAAGQIISGPIAYRYMRVRMTSYTSGTAQAILELYTLPFVFSTTLSEQIGTWTVQPGNVANTTAWLTSETGGTNFASGQVSIGTSATQIASARTNRKKIVISNAGSAAIYLGPSGVTTSTGLYLLNGMAPIELSTSAAIYGIVGSGSQVVTYAEEY